MRRISIIMVLLMGMSILGGCKTGTNNQVTNPPADNQNNQNPIVEVLPGEYFPLSVGSSWEYEGAGNEFASFTRKVLFSQDNLAQTTENNGGTVVTRIIQTTASAVTMVYFAGEDYQPQNLLAKGYTSNANDIILQAPIKVGTTWVGSNTNKSILSLTEAVDTPAGKFDNCIKVKFTNQNDTIYQYYKKGVGMVKQEFISGGTTITSTLKKYEIK